MTDTPGIDAGTSGKEQWHMTNTPGIDARTSGKEQWHMTDIPGIDAGTSGKEQWNMTSSEQMLHTALDDIRDTVSKLVFYAQSTGAVVSGR